jgi:hypothetical protein
MTIPTLSLSGHDRYSPEIRDRILEKAAWSAGERNGLPDAPRKVVDAPEAAGEPEFDARLHKRVIQAHYRPVIIQHRR